MLFGSLRHDYRNIIVRLHQDYSNVKMNNRVFRQFTRPLL